MSIKSGILYIIGCIPPQIRRHFVNHETYDDMYRFCLNSRNWSIQQIREWQLIQLQATVEFAYYHTDGYHQLYDEAGVKPSDLRELQDIRLFPCVEKSLLRNNVNAFTADKGEQGRLHKITTGGSTGLPFEFYLTTYNSSIESAFISSSWSSIGWRGKDIGIKIRGAHVGSPEHLLVKTGYHRYAISSNYLTEDNYEDYMRLIEGTNATFLHVYPSSITELAHLMIAHGDEGRLKINHIFLGSENLYDWQREIISKAFPKAKLFSFYGLSEHTVFADWCEGDAKYHINPFYGYTELLDGDQPVAQGEVGEIVGTSFWNKGTMFIRYRSNDFAKLGPVGCECCGRNFQMLESIDGRLAEFIVGKTGRRISLTVFAGSIMHGENFTHVKQFRFIQFAEGELVLAVVPTQDYSEQDKRRLEASVNDFLGNDFVCEIKEVEELPITKRGKFSYLEQHLKVDRSDINI